MPLRHSHASQPGHMTRRAFKKRVFLSHSHADKPFVEMVSGDISASGVPVWYDRMELVVGDSLTPKITEAIGASVRVAVFLSPHSARSEWVRKELELGLRREGETGEVVVLPLLLQGMRDSDIPPSIADKIYADFRLPSLYDSAFRQLLRAVGPAPKRGRPGLLDEWEAVLPLDGRRRRRLVGAAGASPQMAEWVLDYLIPVAARPDATERHWAYITLGDVGGPRAEAALLEGLADPDRFARRGAEEGLRRLRARASDKVHAHAKEEDDDDAQV